MTIKYLLRGRERELERELVLNREAALGTEAVRMPRAA